MDTTFTSLPIYSYDYNKIETFCLSQKDILMKDNIGLILGVLRGGAVPALMLSQMLSLPVDFLYYDRTNAQVDIKNKEIFQKINQCIEKNQTILLVEDIAGVGHTLLNCYNYLVSLTKNESLIKVLTLVYHGNSRMKPHYYQDFSNMRSVLPWEKYITSQLCFDDFIQVGEALLEDKIYKKTILIDTDEPHSIFVKEKWQIDFHLNYSDGINTILEQIKKIGPEEVYCNNDIMIANILEQFPFIIVYKIVNQKRYRIDLCDE